MNKRVVITGASGNVGTALLRKLAVETDYEVHGVVRRMPPPTDAYACARWHQLDIAEPQAVTHLQKLFRRAHCVVHLAWAFEPIRDRQYRKAVGIDGSYNVLIGAHAADVRHLVYVSSAATYAPAPGRRVDESWLTTGIPTCTYSRLKSAVEKLLDDYCRAGGGMAITRLRPGFIIQRQAAASIRRHMFPGYLPPRWLRLLPLLMVPASGSLQVPVLHADDVADACLRAIQRRAVGAFNLSAEPPLQPQHVVRALGPMPIPVPTWLARSLIDAAWRARLQPIEPGWVDLIASMPLLNTERAQAILSWHPQHTSQHALTELTEGLRRNEGTASPALHSRSLLDGLRRELSRGLITS
ncbi:NAD-dependent epimerase/dehydratase family protein [Mycobacterium sp.]|uniref:NAD-dependent epimerase/dehydratase family protein n=1 Tax=Mycobacterium sp. TaxID=1785 RepID=UPI003F97B933